MAISWSKESIENFDMDFEASYRTRLWFPAGTSRSCENTGQRFSGMNTLQSITSLTRGINLIKHQGLNNISRLFKCPESFSWLNILSFAFYFRNNAVKHVVYYPSLKVKLFTSAIKRIGVLIINEWLILFQLFYSQSTWGFL